MFVSEKIISNEMIILIFFMKLPPFKVVFCFLAACLKNQEEKMLKAMTIMPQDFRR